MIEYRNYRIKLADLFLRSGTDLKTGALWTLNLNNIRFKHGKTLDTLKIPYHFGDEVEKIIDNALLMLVTLFSSRYATNDSFSAQAGAQGVQGQILLREKNYRTDVLIEGTPERKAAKLILRTTPFVDGEMVTLWLEKNGAGKKLMDCIRNLFDKVLKEESKSGAGEPTSFLLLLALISAIRMKKEKLKQVRIQGLSYEKLDMAISQMFFRVFQVSLIALLDDLKNSGVPYYSENTALKLNSSVEPLAFMAIPKTVTSFSINPYGMNEEIYAAIHPKVLQVQDAKNVDELLSAAGILITKDKALSKAINSYYNIIMVRGLILKYLVDFDSNAIMGHMFFYDIIGEDRVLSQVISDKEGVKKLIYIIDTICKDYPKDKKRIDSLLDLKEFLKNMNKKSFMGKDSEAGLEEILLGYYSLMFDARIERFAGHTRIYMDERKSDSDTITLINDYQSGKIYRFSIDDSAVLSVLNIANEAQLFVDMKDFTSKTLSLKESSMVEFMKDNFYEPILSAASKYDMESGRYTVEESIRLNNLPGDAAIFSGGVVNLVALAQDIQAISRQFVDKLIERLPPVTSGVNIEYVHEKYKSVVKQINEKRAELHHRKNSGDTDADAKLMKLAKDEMKIEESYRKTLESVIAEKMEAGVFITYGARAEGIVVKGPKASSETHRVAICEKINEAARGTDRNAMVRAKVEMKLESERVRRKKPYLNYPFEVYIEKIFAIKLPSNLEVAVERLFKKDKSVDAEKVATEIGKKCFGDLKSMSSDDGETVPNLIFAYTGIYNMGEAISQEAFFAYIDETKTDKYFFEKKVEVSRLHQSITNDFYFPFDIIELWFSVEKKGGAEIIECFANVGEITFKGFESKSPTIVYEILDTEGAFMKALMANHFRAWHEEHLKNR